MVSGIRKSNSVSLIETLACDVLAVGDSLPLGVLFEQAASSSVIPARATSVRFMLPPRSICGHKRGDSTRASRATTSHICLTPRWSLDDAVVDVRPLGGRPVVPHPLGSRL